MKKLNLLLLLVLSVAIQSYGQYFTIKLGGGYSVPGIQNSGSVLTFQPGSSPDPASAQIIPLISYNTAAADSPSSKYKSNVYSGYSKGGHFDFGFGYMITPYFGVQIDGAYLWGSTITATQKFDDNLLGPGARIITNTHSTGLSLNPSLIFRGAPAKWKVAPYARVGLALPVQGAIYHSLNITAPNSLLGDVQSSNINVKTESTVSLGMQGAVGVSYTPIPLISVWAELQGQYLLVRAKEADLTKYDLNIGGNNQDLLPGLTNYSKVTNFVDRLDVNSNTQDFGKTRGTTGTNHVDETRGKDVLRQTANLGAFGFSVGVTFNMSKKIFQDPIGKKAKAAAAAK